MPIVSFYERVLQSAHERVFGLPMGSGTINFLKQLRWSMFGGLLASAILFIVAVWAGRVLGVKQYGQFSFVFAIAQVVAVCITWSFEIAIVRALAFTKGDVKSQRYIISSAILFLVLSVICANIFVYILPFQILKGVTMWFATMLSAKLLLDGMMRGLGLFGYQAVGKVIEACAVLFAFFVMLHSGVFTSYTDYLLAIFVGGVVLLFWYAIRVRSDISLHRISRSAFQVLWTYGSRAIVWLMLSTILVFMTKYVIRNELGYEFLGQFTVYQLVSIGALALVGGLIANVFFPVAVEDGGTDEMWHKMHITALVGWAPLWVSGSIATNVAVMLYGHAYYLSWWFGVAMTGIAVAQFLTSMYWWIIASEGVHGVKYMSFHAAIGALIFIVLLSVSIAVNPLLGITSSYAVMSLYSVWAIYRWRVLLNR